MKYFLWYLLLVLSLGVLPPRFEMVKIGISKAYEATTTVMPKITTEEAIEFATEIDLMSVSPLDATSPEDLTLTATIPITTTTLSPSTAPTKTTTTSKLQRVDTTRTINIATTTTTSPNTAAIPITSTESPHFVYNDTNRNQSLVSNGSIFHYHHRGVYCACNLLDNVCDINCCCDADCNVNAFQVFDCFASALGGPLGPDFHYHPGLPSCTINDGWLCVFRSNIKKEKQKIPEILSDTSTLYKWSSLMLESLQSPPSTIDSSVKSFYRLNEPILLIDLETREIVNFELPYAYINTRCLIREPIKHLKSHGTHCQVSTREELQRNKQDLLTLITKYRLLKRPIDIKPIDSMRSEENTIGIKLKRCILHHDDTADDSNDCLEVPITALEVENYYAHEIEIILQHNFTTLQGCEVILKESLLKGSKEGGPYWQSFKVKFQESQEAKRRENLDKKSVAWNAKAYQQAISGPLGYLQAQPIIIAHYIALNASAEMNTDNRVLNYFHPNATRLRHNHALYTFSQRKGKCIQKASSEYSINYGINQIKQCHVRLEKIEDLTHNPAERNFTIICRELQRLALKQLLGTISELQEIWISQLGRPQNNTEEKWIPLEWHNVEFAPVVGVYNERSQQSFVCRNMLLNVVHEFQVGTFTEQDVWHQNLIKQATLTYGERHDLEFDLTELLELPLSVSVMFYDYVNVLEGQQLRSTAGQRSICNMFAQFFCLFVISLICEFIK